MPPAKNYVWPSTSWHGEIFRKLTLGPAVGTADCVGMVGATLGGGVGGLQGIRGLLSDALESVRLVTANGDLITASRTEHKDLFWALRGAGANFGIVTSATYKIFDATNNGQVFNADFIFPASANESIWRTIKGYDNMPAPLVMNTAVLYNATIGEVNTLPFRQN